MKHAILLAAVLSTIALTACESKEKTVITTPAPAATPSTVIVPGPAGPKGDAGAPGASGSTTVIVPPAEEKKP